MPPKTAAPPFGRRCRRTRPMRCSICCLSSCFLWRFRRCHHHRSFHRALGRPCAAPPYKGHAVLPSLSSAFLCTRRHRRNLENRRSLRRAGGCVLLCQPVCAGLCQHLWRHRHCRQHHRAEFRIFHLLLQPPPTSAKTMWSGNPCAAKILRLCLRPHRPVSRRFLPAVYFRSACCSKRLRPHSVYPVFLSPSVTYTKFPPRLCAAPAILCCPRPPWS